MPFYPFTSIAMLHYESGVDLGHAIYPEPSE